MTLPRGVSALLAYVATVQCPVCWNSTSGPPLPVDSRLMKAPMLGAHLLLCAKPCDACRYCTWSVQRATWGIAEGKGASCPWTPG